MIFLQAQPDAPFVDPPALAHRAHPIGVITSSHRVRIPIFFPSVEIDGRHFGDGSIRNTAPLSPAINLGADRIIAIGVQRPAAGPCGRRGPRKPPTIAQIAGVLLDAVMLDAIEIDVEHSERVNTSVLALFDGGGGHPFRRVDILWLRPSALVREMASELSHRIPAVVRYLMRGLGSDESVTELASYLLFDSEFCSRLIDLGRRDVAAERDRIADLLRARCDLVRRQLTITGRSRHLHVEEAELVAVEIADVGSIENRHPLAGCALVVAPSSIALA